MGGDVRYNGEPVRVGGARGEEGQIKGGGKFARGGLGIFPCTEPSPFPFQQRSRRINIYNDRFPN